MNPNKNPVSPPAASPEQAAEVELPPIPCGKPHNSKYWDDGIEWAVAGERAIRMEREDQLRIALAESQRLRQQLAKDDDTQAEMAKRIAELEKDVDLAKRERNMYDSAHKREAANVLNLSARLRAVSEALEQADAYCPTCAHNKNAGHADGCDEAGWIISDPTIFNQLRAIVEGK